MGFAKKVLKPSVPQSVNIYVPTATKTSPTIVTESVQADVEADYEQTSSRRKGLLSTILSDRRHNAAAGGGNATLG